MVNTEQMNVFNGVPVVLGKQGLEKIG